MQISKSSWHYRYLRHTGFILEGELYSPFRYILSLALMASLNALLSCIALIGICLSCLWMSESYQAAALAADQELDVMDLLSGAILIPVGVGGIVAVNQLHRHIARTIRSTLRLDTVVGFVD